MDATTVVGSVFAAFGLSGAAGLNAWLPLFVSALLDRVGLVDLAAPFDSLSSNSGLLLLGAAMVVDLIGDKIPAVDHVLHAAGTVIAPVSGAALFAGQTGEYTDLSSLVAIVLGGGTAGAIQLGRSAVRAGSTATTGGIGNPLLSLGEDVGAGTLVAMAFLVPVLAVALVVALVVTIALTARRIRRGLRARRERRPGPPAALPPEP